MLRRSVILSLLTAMFSAEVAKTSNAASAPPTTNPITSADTGEEEKNENLRILVDARQTVGRELSRL